MDFWFDRKLSQISSGLFGVKNNNENLNDAEKTQLARFGIDTEDELSRWESAMQNIGAENIEERAKVWEQIQYVARWIKTRAGEGNEQQVAGILLSVLESASDLKDLYEKLERAYDSMGESTVDRGTIDQIVYDFVKGYSTKEEVHTKLNNAGIKTEDIKITYDSDGLHAGTTTLEFTYNGQKYVAKLGSSWSNGSSVVHNQVVDYDMANSIFQSAKASHPSLNLQFEDLFEIVVSIDGKPAQCVISGDISSKFCISTTIQAVQSWAETQEPSDAEKRLLEFKNAYANGEIVGDADFAILKSILSELGITPTETSSNNQTVLSFEYKGEKYSFIVNKQSSSIDDDVRPCDVSLISHFIGKKEDGYEYSELIDNKDGTVTVILQKKGNTQERLEIKVATSDLEDPILKIAINVFKGEDRTEKAESIIDSYIERLENSVSENDYYQAIEAYKKSYIDGTISEREFKAELEIKLYTLQLDLNQRYDFESALQSIKKQYIDNEIKLTEFKAAVKNAFNNNNNQVISSINDAIKGLSLDNIGGLSALIDQKIDGMQITVSTENGQIFVRIIYDDKEYNFGPVDADIYHKNLASLCRWTDEQLTALGISQEDINRYLKPDGDKYMLNQDVIEKDFGNDASITTIEHLKEKIVQIQADIIFVRDFLTTLGESLPDTFMSNTAYAIYGDMSSVSKAKVRELLSREIDGVNIIDLVAELQKTYGEDKVKEVLSYRLTYPYDAAKDSNLKTEEERENAFISKVIEILTKAKDEILERDAKVANLREITNAIGAGGAVLNSLGNSMFDEISLESTAKLYDFLADNNLLNDLKTLSSMDEEHKKQFYNLINDYYNSINSPYGGGFNPENRDIASDLREILNTVLTGNEDDDTKELEEFLKSLSGKNFNSYEALKSACGDRCNSLEIKQQSEADGVTTYLVKIRGKEDSTGVTVTIGAVNKKDPEDVSFDIEKVKKALKLDELFGYTNNIFISANSTSPYQYLTSGTNGINANLKDKLWEYLKPLFGDENKKQFDDIFKEVANDVIKNGDIYSKYSSSANFYDPVKLVDKVIEGVIQRINKPEKLTEEDKTAILNQVKTDAVSTGIDGTILTEGQANALYTKLVADEDISGFEGTKDEFTKLVNEKAKTYAKEILDSDNPNSDIQTLIDWLRSDESYLGKLCTSIKATEITPGYGIQNDIDNSGLPKSDTRTETLYNDLLKYLKTSYRSVIDKLSEETFNDMYKQAWIKAVTSDSLPNKDTSTITKELFNNIADILETYISNGMNSRFATRAETVTTNNADGSVTHTTTEYCKDDPDGITKIVEVVTDYGDHASGRRTYYIGEKVSYYFDLSYENGGPYVPNYWDHGSYEREYIEGRTSDGRLVYTSEEVQGRTTNTKYDENERILNVTAKGSGPDYSENYVYLDNSTYVYINPQYDSSTGVTSYDGIRVYVDNKLVEEESWANDKYTKKVYNDDGSVTITERDHYSELVYKEVNGKKVTESYTTFEYKDGHIVTATTCDDINGNVISVTEYSYNGKGQIKSSVTKDKDGNLIEKTKYKYSYGYLDSSTTTYADGTKVTKDYNTSGRVLLEVTKKDGKVVSKVEYTYDGIGPSGKLLKSKKTTVYNSDGTMTVTILDKDGKTVQTLDKKGNVVSEERYDIHGKKITGVAENNTPEQIEQEESDPMEYDFEGYYGADGVILDKTEEKLSDGGTKITITVSNSDDTVTIVEIRKRKDGTIYSWNETKTVTNEDGTITEIYDSFDPEHKREYSEVYQYKNENDKKGRMLSEEDFTQDTSSRYTYADKDDWYKVTACVEVSKDEKGNTVSRTFEDGELTSIIVVDDKGNKLSETIYESDDECDTTTEIKYGENHEIKSEKITKDYGGGDITVIEIDDKGNKTTTTTKDGVTTIERFDSQGNPIQVGENLPITEAPIIDDPNTTVTENADGTVTITKKDDKGNVISEVVTKDDKKVSESTNTYDEDNNLVETHTINYSEDGTRIDGIVTYKYSVNEKSGIKTVQQYEAGPDGKEVLTRETKMKGTQVVSEIEYKRDQDGNIMQSWRVDYSDSGQLRYKIETSVNRDGTTTVKEYWAYGVRTHYCESSERIMDGDKVVSETYQRRTIDGKLVYTKTTNVSTNDETGVTTTIISIEEERNNGKLRATGVIESVIINGKECVTHEVYTESINGPTSKSEINTDYDADGDITHRVMVNTAINGGITSVEQDITKNDDGSKFVVQYETDLDGTRRKTYEVRIGVDESGNEYEYKTEYCYNKDGSVAAEYTDKNGKNISSTYYNYNSDGSLNFKSIYNFDDNGICVGRVTYQHTYNADGTTTIRQTESDSSGKTYITSDVTMKDGEEYIRTEYKYDESGRLVASYTDRYGDEVAKTEYKYDNNGNLVNITTNLKDDAGIEYSIVAEWGNSHVELTSYGVDAVSKESFEMLKDLLFINQMGLVADWAKSNQDLYNALYAWISGGCDGNFSWTSGSGSGSSGGSTGWGNTGYGSGGPQNGGYCPDGTWSPIADGSGFWGPIASGFLGVGGHGGTPVMGIYAYGGRYQ